MQIKTTLLSEGSCSRSMRHYTANIRKRIHKKSLTHQRIQQYSDWGSVSWRLPSEKDRSYRKRDKNVSLNKTANHTIYCDIDWKLLVFWLAKTELYQSENMSSVGWNSKTSIKRKHFWCIILCSDYNYKWFEKKRNTEGRIKALKTRFISAHFNLDSISLGLQNECILLSWNKHPSCYMAYNTAGFAFIFCQVSWFNKLSLSLGCFL